MKRLVLGVSKVEGTTTFDFVVMGRYDDDHSGKLDPGEIVALLFDMGYVYEEAQVSPGTCIQI